MGTAEYERGSKRLAAVTGSAGQKVVDGLRNISPDFGRYIVEFAYGEIHSRPGLTMQQRQLITIAALTALGNAQPQLKIHIAAAIHTGVKRDEIIEAIIQMAVYAGFPATLNGLSAAQEVFTASGL
ncbi:carboxymuconolactone decarboxylase family protein [Paraherbaspirillum soli]|uniref:Carboxymuconolactone decarboxylase family protein n=1 Tax=Paraherbaspirillum soli TaxID=631222 RepID=A0ABW0ME99_9BURK